MDQCQPELTTPIKHPLGAKYCMRTDSSGMQIRYSALALGLLFLVLAIAGFIPGLVASNSEASAYSDGFGYIFGIFPTNYLHNAIGILVGLWGIAAFTSLVGSITFNQIFAVVYLLQAILGLLPATNTLFGTMPLYGNNVWLSILTAAIAFYYGFVKPVEVSRNSNISTPTSA